MSSTLSLPDGTKYLSEPIDDSYDVHVGDQFVFLAKSQPKTYAEIHEKVVTVKSVSSMGGLAVHEYRSGSHFVRRCFHEIVWEREVSTNDFEAVFS